MNLPSREILLKFCTPYKSGCILKRIPNAKINTFANTQVEARLQLDLRAFCDPAKARILTRSLFGVNKVYSFVNVGVLKLAWRKCQRSKLADKQCLCLRPPEA